MCALFYFFYVGKPWRWVCRRLSWSRQCSHGCWAKPSRPRPADKSSMAKLLLVSHPFWSNYRQKLNKCRSRSRQQNRALALWKSLCRKSKCSAVNLTSMLQFEAYMYDCTSCNENHLIFLRQKTQEMKATFFLSEKWRWQIPTWRSPASSASAGEK